jgi:hypothetical protein
VEENNIHWAALALDVLIVGTIAVYGSSPRLLLAGVWYVISAGCLSLISSFSMVTLRKATGSELSAWPFRRRASVLLLVAWQLEIVGLFSMGASGLSSRSAVALSCLTTAVFVAVAYKMVSLADSPEQDGGAKPINYFGRPRSRRIFFAGFVYTPIGPLLILSAAWSGHRWCPKLLQPPQLWLLLITLLSGMAAGMIFQRYRLATGNRVLATRISVSTVCLLACSVVSYAFSAGGAWVLLLSSTVVICAAGTAYWLLLARESNRTAPGRVPSLPN